MTLNEQQTSGYTQELAARNAAFKGLTVSIRSKKSVHISDGPLSVIHSEAGTQPLSPNLNPNGAGHQFMSKRPSRPEDPIRNPKILEQMFHHTRKAYLKNKFSPKIDKEGKTFKTVKVKNPLIMNEEDESQISALKTRINSSPGVSIRHKRARTPMIGSGLKSRNRRGNDSVFSTRR